MSLVTVSFTYSFVDDAGKTSSTKIRVPLVGMTLVDISEFGLASAQVLADLSSCKLTKTTACVGVDLTGLGLRAVATATSDIAHKALVMIRSSIGAFTRMIIPTFNESFQVPNSDQVDTADASVVALVTAIEDGIAVTGGTVTPVDRRGYDIESVDDIREIFRKFKPVG